MYSKKKHGAAKMLKAVGCAANAAQRASQDFLRKEKTVENKT